MKSVHYVSTVANCYKAASDAWHGKCRSLYAIKDDSIDELWKVAQRELVTGFYYKTLTENEQPLVLVVKFHNTNLLVKSLTLTQQL